MGAPSFAQIQAGGSKFGLTDAELQQGLNAFASWHQNRFGGGFTNESSAGAIVNGAVQNALNAKANPNFYSQSWTSWEGGGPQGSALNYSATPERIAQHREDAISALVNGGWVDGTLGVLNADFNGLNFSYRNGVGDDGSYASGQNWTADEGRKLAALAVDKGIAPVNEYLTNYMRAVGDAGSNQKWWAPQAVLSNAATSLGADVTKYVDAAEMARQQNAVATTGQERQAANGNPTNWGLIGGLALGGLGLAGAFGGAAAGLGEGALASTLAAEGSSALVGSSIAADLAGTTALSSLGGVGSPGIAGDIIASGAGGGSVAAPTTSLSSLSTGSSIADRALLGAGKSLLTGEDPLKGALIGGVTGAVGDLMPSTGNTFIDNALKGAAGAAVSGGNPLTGALAGGVTPVITDAIPDSGNIFIDRAVNGAVGGSVGAGLNGGNVLTGALTGGATGLLNTAAGSTLDAGSTALNGILNSTSNTGTTDSTTAVGNLNLDNTDYGTDGGAGGDGQFDSGGNYGNTTNTDTGTTSTGGTNMYDEYGNYMGDETGNTLDETTGTDVVSTPNDWWFMDELTGGGGGGDWDFMNDPTNVDGTNSPTSVNLGKLWKWLSTGTGTDGKGRTPLSMLGLGATGIADYMGANKRFDYLKGIDERNWNAGAPSRGRYEAAMTPGFDINTMPGYKQAMDTATETYLRKLSATGGNPAGIGAAPSQTMAYTMGTVGLPAWERYTNQNANAGGIGALAASSPTTGAMLADASGGPYNSVGKSISAMTNPTMSLRDLLNIANPV